MEEKREGKHGVKRRSFLGWLIIFGILIQLSLIVDVHVKQLSAATMASPDSITQARIEEDFGKLPLYFIENRGQVDSRVEYYVKGHDKVLFFTKHGVTFVLKGKNETSSLPVTFVSRASYSPYPSKVGRSLRWAIRLEFVGANQDEKPVGIDRTKAVVSYFKGKHDEWKAGVKTYGGVLYRDLWPGIDLIYTGTVSRLKYRFVVKPGADPNVIRLAYRGVTSIAINDAGQLDVKTPAGGFKDDRPYTYQDVDGRRVEVATSYRVDSDGEKGRYVCGFKVGCYDKTKPLVVDPAVLVYCGYIGGSVADSGKGIALDGDGNAYVTGSTYSDEATFPVTVGPDLIHNGFTDAFVAKVNAAGTALEYCGYIGGSDHDLGYGIAVDLDGNAYVTGSTYSSEATFPVTVGPDVTYNSSGDVFVAKVNESGTALLYCGYIGGGVADLSYGIAINGDGNAYVTGSTNSDETTFPVTTGPDLTHNGGQDVFVAKVNAAGSALEYCGYIGGSDEDEGQGIALDGNGDAYVTGNTRSDEATFPVTVGPNLIHNGGQDVFVAKVNASGSELEYCGYIGGSDNECGYDIAADSDGNAYVTGETGSDETSFPVSVGPDLSHNGITDAFVAKLNDSGTSLMYCGYIGGEDEDFGNSIVADGDGNAYVVGSTYSDEATFPVTVGPDLNHNGSGDVFVAKISTQTGGAEFFVKTDGTGTACTQVEPCSLQTALDLSEESDTVYVATGTYTGTGQNVITLTNSILLYGGWDGSPTGPVVLDPETYPTTLDGEDSRRVIHISGTISPSIDGFIITRGNATGLITDCYGLGGDPDGCGGGLFVYQANPHISNNVISDNVAAVTTDYPISQTGFGGGVYIRASSDAEITNNTFTGNIGSQAYNGAGGGLCTSSCGIGVRVEDNRFNNNYGTTTDMVGWGGGIHLGSSGALVQNNIIQDNVASSGGLSQGSGLFQWQGAPIIHGNLMSGNQFGSTVYLGYSGAIFEANYVVGNNATTGVQLVNQAGLSGPTLQNNIITGNGTYSVHIDGNNSYPLSVTLNHNTLVGEGADYGIYINDYSAVSMTNNIVSGHTDTGIFLFDPSTSSVSADHTLFWENTDDGERGTNPVDGDPAFVNPAGLNYHIRAISAAIDMGEDIGVTTDIDNDTRPLIDGYDIGADEYNPYSYDDELALDFGISGLWDYNGTDWTFISGSSPEGMVGWSGGLAMDFGASGLWNYDGTTWISLSGSNIEDMADWGNGLALDFGASGVWSYDGTNWAFITGASPEDMAGWFGGLALDFGASGVWNYDGTNWAFVSSSSPEGMVGWSGGLAMDFGASGLWNYDGTTWTPLSGADVEGMGGWPHGISIDFGASGLWSYEGTTWTLITGSSPEGMTGWADGLALDFGFSGLWSYDGTNWTYISGSNVEDMDDVDLY